MGQVTWKGSAAAVLTLALVLLLEVAFLQLIFAGFGCCGSSAALCMDLCGIVHCLELGAMLVDHGSKVLACTDGCSASAGPIFRLVLGRCGKHVTCFLFQWSGWFHTQGSVRGGSDTRQVGWSLQGWMCPPPIEEECLVAV